MGMEEGPEDNRFHLDFLGVCHVYPNPYVSKTSAGEFYSNKCRILGPSKDALSMSLRRDLVICMFSHTQYLGPRSTLIEIKEEGDN